LNSTSFISRGSIIDNMSVLSMYGKCK